MQQTSIQGNQLKIQIVQSTCLFNKKLNKNNAIDGTNIIYLAGSSIVFHNIFQNTKKFINRLSDSDVIGMAFFKSSENIIALATKPKPQVNHNQQSTPQNINKNGKKLSIQLYVLGQEGCLLAQLSQNIEFIDMEFIQKKRIVLMVKQYNQFYFYFLQPNKKLKKKQVNIDNPKKFIAQDRRIAVLGKKGMKQFDGEVQNLSAQLRFQDIEIQDYAIIDNQFEVLLSDNKLYCYHDLEMVHEVELNQFVQKQQQKLSMVQVQVKSSKQKNSQQFQQEKDIKFAPKNVIQANNIVRVGRNLLVAHKNSITLSHFIIDNNRLKFLNHFAYKQKIKGGILSLEVSFDEMHLAMSVQLIEKDCTKMQNFMFNLSILSSEKKFINPFIRMIPLGTQNSQITSLQGVIASQTYYLSGNTIVNYSHNDQIQKRFKYSLHETPKQIAVHPLGYQFVCVFQTQIKFYLKIQNQLVQIWNQQMICSYVKYNVSGLLLIACLQDNFYQLLIYDTNSFKRIKNIQNIYIKHPVSRIQLAEQDSQVILYVDRDLSIYKLKNGQKIAEFREKKQKDQILAIAYDPNWMTLLVATSSKSLLYCKKIDEIGWDFKFQKSITLPEQVTSIEINCLLETVFLGTKSGKLLWAQYPLNLIETTDMKITLQLQQLKLTSQPINQIHLTNNLKYLFISFNKNQGLVICKLRKIIKYQGNTRYNQFDISNLNFLETSSKNSLQSGYEKLKVLLEKRKTVFNDLDEYKKQWEIKKNKKIKQLDKENKFKQLNHINQALSHVQKLKKQKNDYHEELKKVQEQTETFLKQKEEKYQREIMMYYDENISLRVKKQKIHQKCQSQYQLVLNKCKQNIKQIDSQLKCKFQSFMQNFNQMKKNLLLYQKRLQIQKQQAQQILLQLFQQKRQKLSVQQSVQNKKSNQLKALITKYKKQSQRFQSRKYFLEAKRNFFLQQLNFCKSEKDQLNMIKEELQDQLKQLQILTNKKQKRLRKYFKENQILTKYQLIHNNLVTNLNDEVKFLAQQRDKTGKNIVSIQKQLSQIAELNQSYEQKISQYKKFMQKMKQKNYLSAQKTRYLLHVIEQMNQAIQKTKINLNDENKAALFGSIYKDFYIKRQLQKIIQSSQAIDPAKQQQQIQYKIFNSAQNKKKLIENMKKHREYLQKNMNLFEKHNKKTDQQMNLNYLKYQTQNYNLIAECNVRKQQTNKKKRILHQLIDSVKQTQLYMNELQKQNLDDAKMMKSVSVQKSGQNIPFIQYKKNKQQMEKSRLKVLRKEESEPTLWKVRQSTYQVRKMLDIQKLNRPGSQNNLERRIKTAMIKNRKSDHTIHIESSEFLNNVCVDNRFETKKPMTATGKRHQAPFGQYYNYSGSKNKSTSKPTTCTTHTNKNKTSIYH